MKQHKGLPSVVSILTGEDLSFSWWSHEKSHTIFRVLSELDEHPDVLICKLINGKDTLIHRRLFSAFLTLALQDSHSALSAGAKRMLAVVEAADSPLPAAGDAAKELVLKLKVRAFEVHTDTGKHALRLQSWARWARAAKVAPLASAPEARAALARAAEALGVRKPLPL